MNNQLPKRKSIRLSQYDYSQNGAYFITICTKDRRHLLSKIHTVGAIRESPLQGRSDLSKIIGYLKMNASKQIHEKYGNIEVWQRGYYDHVVRNQVDYDDIYRCIENNPTQWELDELYTDQ